MLGYEAIPELVHRGGTTVVFAMLGGTNVPWVAEGVRSGRLRLVRTRHEETAVNAAAGYARAAGTTGVCTVTRGPGFANSVNGMIAATKGHVPVVLVVGESPATRERTEQNIDQRGLTAAIGAGFHHATVAAELEPCLRAAMNAARWNGCPQVVSIADGMLDARIELSDETAVPTPPAAVHGPTPDPEAVAASVDALARAERPLVVAGQGAVLADCREPLEELALLVGARVATTLRANRFFAGNPADLGLCGSWSPEPVRAELARTDVLLAVGASLNEHTTAEGTLFGGATVIHCEKDIEQPCFASAPELALFGDARGVVTALVDEWRRRGLPARPVREPVPDRDEVRAAVRGIDLGHDPARGLDLRDVYCRFDELLPSDRVVVTDSGRSLGTLPTLVSAADARSWLVGRGYGSVGLGLGTAIGAATAHPGRPVVLFCGDGGFMMSSHDLDAVRINDLDLTVVIMNDEAYGSEIKYLTRYGLPRDVVVQSLPDVPAIAAAFGGRGHVVRTLDDLDGVEVGLPGLTLVDVRLDPEVSGRAAF